MRYPLHDLSSEVFVQLCADLLKAENKFESVRLFSHSKNTGYDIEAFKGISKIAIEVKHKLIVTENALTQEILKAQKALEFYHEYFFITSAKLSSILKEEFSTRKIKILDQDNITKLLTKHNDIAESYFKNLKEEKKKIYARLFGSIVAVLAILISSYTIFFDGNQNQANKPLDQKIQNLEQVLNGMRNIESDLKSIKQDMIETEINNKRILAEYEKIKGVEKIIDERKSELNSVLNYKPWSTRLLEFLFGTAFGIFTSIISSILFEKWKHKLSLK